MHHALSTEFKRDLADLIARELERRTTNPTLDPSDVIPRGYTMQVRHDPDTTDVTVVLRPRPTTTGSLAFFRVVVKEVR